jgi:malate dehydrogenase (oxaloacetate-decarboxylating)
VISEESLAEDYIVPSVFDERVAPAVAETVAQAARKNGTVRRMSPQEQEIGISTPLLF